MSPNVTGRGKPLTSGYGNRSWMAPGRRSSPRRWSETTPWGGPVGPQRWLQCGPGPSARGRGSGKGGCQSPVETIAVDGEGTGCSRGGLSSKIRPATDGRGLPMSVILTGGQEGDNPQLVPLLDQISVARPAPDRAGPGPSPRRGWRTRRIRTPPPRRVCGAAGSGSPAPNGPVKRPAGQPRVLPVAARRPLTGRSAKGATWSSGASTGSGSSGTWPPATPHRGNRG